MKSTPGKTSTIGQNNIDIKNISSNLVDDLSWLDINKKLSVLSRH
jgi:hypothetical protein